MTEPCGSLADELAISDVEHDALVTTLAFFFAQGEWQSGRTITYRTEDGQVGATLVYGRDGDLADVERRPGLTDEMLNELRERLVLASHSETVVWRDVFFNVRPVEGFWRYRDDWQIVPAPPQAPRPDLLLGDHPFIVEIRLPQYPDQAMLTATTQDRRAWELLLILNLVALGRVSRIGPRHHGHVWAFVGDELPPDTRYVQPGYSIPDWIYQSEDFTPTDDMDPLREVPDDEYRSRRGVGPGDVFEIPDILRPLLNHYHLVGPETRDRFLRACYWYERSEAAWSMSVSLGYIAAVKSIETLMPPGETDLCPTCGLNRAPGVTRRFRDFLERYAPTTPEEDRRTIYKLRSALVHEGDPLDIDVPRPWGVLIPRDIEQQDTYASARAAAREAIVTSLLDQDTDTASN